MSATEILAALIGGALGWIVGAAMNELHSLRPPLDRGLGDGAPPRRCHPRSHPGPNVASPTKPPVWAETNESVNGDRGGIAGRQAAEDPRRHVAV